MPSNQRQIIEQAKFIYSPLGKAFKKQTKTTEDEGEKQIKAIRDKSKENKKYSNYGYKNELLLSKEREIFRDIYNDRLDQTERVSNDVDFRDLRDINLMG